MTNIFAINEIKKGQVFSYTQSVDIIALIKKAFCDQGKKSITSEKSITLKISHDAMSIDEPNSYLIIEVLKVEDWGKSIIL